MTRIVFDISTLSRWTGPPVGIVRVERELARWIKADLPAAVFAFFDPQKKRYLEIRADRLDAILEGKIALPPLEIPAATGRRRRSDRIPKRIRPVMMTLLQLRRTLLFWLEHIRVLGRRPIARTIADQMQQVLMTEKYRRIFFESGGIRRQMLPYESIVGKPIELKQDDILICTGAGWEHQDIQALRALKIATSFRLVTICYDLIPLLFPEYYKPNDVAAFRKHFHFAFPITDLVIVTSRAVERDVVAYCAENRLPLCRIEIVSPGADIGQIPSGRSKLPAGIERERFALFVSTIEPRKGHELMYNIWLRLLAEGVPQRTGFKLVFVGRPGWMVDDLIQSLRSDARIAETLRMFTFVGDDELAALYDAAGFCVYPSAYEGYGLPIIEAFSHGKAVLASNGGALVEIVGELSPCLDPRDQELWYSMMKRWILEPAARAPYEVAIRAHFRPRSWRECAAQFLQIVGSVDVARTGITPSR